MRDIVIGDEAYLQAALFFALRRSFPPVCVKVGILSVSSPGSADLPQLWRADDIENLGVCRHGRRDGDLSRPRQVSRGASASAAALPRTIAVREVDRGGKRRHPTRLAPTFPGCYLYLPQLQSSSLDAASSFPPPQTALLTGGDKMSLRRAKKPLPKGEREGVVFRRYSG
jgi:hypothetical protein